MRGIRIEIPQHHGSDRITPAHAGNTKLAEALHVAPRDHPRACGEYQYCMPTRTLAPGSPPRMRGIPSRCISRWPRTGITPAHAGNTPRRYIAVLLNRDHPRACGEYPGAAGCRHPRKGSPPRMRGILDRFWAEYPRKGITPAHAGNTYLGIGKHRRM